MRCCFTEMCILCFEYPLRAKLSIYYLEHIVGMMHKGFGLHC